MTTEHKPHIRHRYRFEVRAYPHPLGGWGIWDRAENRWLDRALDRVDARRTVRDLNDPDFEPAVEELGV